MTADRDELRKRIIAIMTAVRFKHGLSGQRGYARRVPPPVTDPLADALLPFVQLERATAKAAGWDQGYDAGRRLLADLHTYAVPDSPKMLRETLCVAQSAVVTALVRGGTTPGSGSMQSHMDRLSRLIDECDRHRPLGSDGKHGNRHTPTCGCPDRQAQP